MKKRTSDAWTPPRHGRTGKGRVYIRADRPEWQSYAADYEAVHGCKPVPNSHGGRWFNILGEAAA